MGNLQENTHYQIVVTRNKTDLTQFSVSIRCQCGKSIALTRKPTGCKPWQISNWTKHYKNAQCNQKNANKEKQGSLLPFLNNPPPATTLQEAVSEENEEQIDGYSPIISNSTIPSTIEDNLSTLSPMTQETPDTEIPDLTQQSISTSSSPVTPSALHRIFSKPLLQH